MKKGELTFASVILGALFILTMVIAAPYLYTVLFSKSDIEVCRASVNVKSISTDVGSYGTGLADPLQLAIDCHTGFLVARKDGVYQETRPGKNKKIQDFSEKSDERFKGKELDFKIGTAVADKMWDCWYMFGAGEDKFSKLGGNHCISCYEMQFDESVQKEATLLPEFTKFLTEEYKSPKRETTYAKYIFKTDNVNDIPQIELDTRKQYGIAYMRGTDKFVNEAGKAALGGGTLAGCVAGAYGGGAIGSIIPGAGTAAGAVAGFGLGCASGLVIGVVTSNAITSDVAMAIAVMPVEELAKDCTKIY